MQLAAIRICPMRACRLRRLASLLNCHQSWLWLLFSLSMTCATYAALSVHVSAGKRAASATFASQSNTPPTITASAAITHPQGKHTDQVVIASVGDAETDKSKLKVEVASAPTGIALGSFFNSNGVISAGITVTCNAPLGANTIVLRVTDGDGLTATANLIINVVNPPPTLGTYPTTIVLVLGANTLVQPSAAPIFNGIFSTLRATAPDFTGTLRIDQTTGVVQIGQAGPVGNYTVTVTATNECGAQATQTFNLIVTADNTPPNISPAAALTRQQGSEGAVSRIAGVSDAESPPGILTVTATTVPAGITVSNLVNVANNPGLITANVAAGCNATVGANTVVLTVSDGSLTATANLIVNVTANTPPRLGMYSGGDIIVGIATTITASPPSDNGSVVSLTATGISGVTSDVRTGSISIPGNLPLGFYQLTITATDNCGATATKNIRLAVRPPFPLICLPAPGGLVGWYRGEGNANDTMSTNRGVLLNGAGFVLFGQVGSAFGFDGVDDLVSLGNAPAILGKGAFSLEAWVKTPSTARQVIIQQRDKHEINGEYQLSVEAGTGRIRWLTFGDNAFAFNFTSQRSINNGDWHHLVVTREADGRGRIYLDGEFDSEQAAPPRTLARIGVYLGGDQRDDTAYFNGQLDEVSFYNRALMDIEALVLFEAGFISKCLPENRLPTISAAAALTRQQGVAGTVAALATVSDIETADGRLIVAATTVPAGLTLTNLTNTNGTVSATLAAGCTAAVGANTIVLTVTDGNTGTATANLTVNVTANTPPTLGAYPATAINAGAGATVTPSAAPADNVTLASVTASAPNFTGTLSANAATGVVTINNAGPAGNYSVTVTATDNCGATTTGTFSLTVKPVSTSPTITTSPPLNRAQGSIAAAAVIASVNDDQTPRGNLTVTAIVPSGVTIANLTNTNGQISANVAVDCSAIQGANTTVLTVTDGDGLTATANFIVNVTANTPPDLFTYPATIIELGKSKTVLPTAPPADNGNIISLTAAASEGFTGTFVTNPATGSVVINNAGPLGDYTVTLTALDNCAALSTRAFPLIVQPVNTVPTITAGGPLTRQQGSAASVATIALVNDGQTPPGDLIVTPSAPPGLTISNISNSRGTLTASVAAGCNAALGANTVVLTVNDGGGLTATANLTVNVTANTPPTLGSYSAISAKVGANAAAVPNAAPTDSGALVSVTGAISTGFTGALSVNPNSGVVTINNAAPAGTHTVTVRATDNCGVNTTATFQLTVGGELICTNPRVGLVSWYRAEGNANDFKAVNNGALQNGVSFAAGQVGQAFSFNGTNEVVIPNSASLNPQQFTFEGWINPTQLDGGVDLILNKEDEPFTTFHYEIGIRGNDGGGGTIPVGNLAFALNGVAGLPSDFNGWINGGGAAPLNTWTHIALTFNGTSARTYLNGVLARSVAGLTGSLITSSGPLKLGSRSNALIAQTPQDRFNGLIDELSLYNRALSDQEIQVIFNANHAGKCTVPINTPPTITAAPPLTAQQGSPATTVAVATVNDADTAAGDLTVTVVSAPGGLTLSNILNTNGTITTSLSAACNAAVGANTVTLQVSDGGLTSTTPLTVQVSANAPPVLGNYASPGTLELGAGVIVTPTVPPADNGVIASLTATASGIFTGSLSVNPVTGAVTISNARPGGNYTVNIIATDNCGLSATTSFGFAVGRLNSSLVLTASAPPHIQGQPLTLTAMVAATQVSVFIPSGAVTFFDGTTMLGVAALDSFSKANLTTAIEPGTRGITAVYSGDNNFSGATSAPLGLSVARAVVNVSAASFRGEMLAPEQIVAAFGTRLATTTAQAQTLPLPSVLGGTVVRMRDSAGRERSAPLFYISPTQVNYLLPSDVATGPALVTVIASDGTNSLANIQLARTNPGIFTADASGRGLPAAQVLRVLPNGSQRLEPVAIFDQGQNRFVAVPIDLGAVNEQVFLILYGTGWRLRDTAIPATATLGGVSAEVNFIGAQSSLPGLDQANLRLPRTLAGRGEIEVLLTVDGKPANTVRINVK